MKRKCKDCSEIFDSYSSLQNRCFECTKKRFKPIGEGKVAKRWKKFRTELLNEAGKNHEGYYVCENGEWVKIPDLDHDKKRSTNPELRFVEKNIKIMSPRKHRTEKHG